MSVVYILNSVGDSGEPCGIPAVILTVLDPGPLSLICSVLMMMKLWMVLSRWEGVPFLHILYMSLSCDTLSKPLGMSKKTPKTLWSRYSLSYI